MNPWLLPSKERLWLSQERGPFSHTTIDTCDLHSPRNWTRDQESLSHSALETGVHLKSEICDFTYFWGESLGCADMANIPSKTGVNGNNILLT